ncbi:MAG TPA: YdbH domain-containing protein, partial [Psychromonas sp.]
QAVFIRLANESGQLTLNVDLLKKDFHLKTAFNSEKFLQYIKLPEAYRALIKGTFTLSYSADLKKWEYGQFALKSSGDMSPLAEKTMLNMAGDINLLSKQVSLQRVDLGLTKVNYGLTNNSLLKVPYVKLTLPKPASINLSTGININTLPVQLRIGGGSVQTKIESGITPGIRTNIQKFPPLLVKINAHGKTNNLNMDWSVSLINSTISGGLKYHSKILTANIKKGQLSAPVLIDGLQDYLAAVRDWTVAKGTINYQLNAKYNLQTKTGYVKSLLKGQDLKGQKGTILFDGLGFNSDTDFEVQNENIHIKQGKQQLVLDNLFVGVPIQAMQINAHSRAGITVIDNFNALLLGGEVSFENLKIQPQNGSSINLSGLSLSEIIKYSAYPAITAKGLLDGVLPLTLTSQGVNIEQGVIFARAPGGYIKIPQDDVVKKLASTHPAFAFTLRLLSNFQFDSLQGRIGYTADGEVDINAEIHGMNPDVSGKKPVKFNYTHTENILRLLESLRFSDELTRQIQEKY